MLNFLAVGHPIMHLSSANSNVTLTLGKGVSWNVMNNLIKLHSRSKRGIIKLVLWVLATLKVPSQVKASSQTPCLELNEAVKERNRLLQGVLLWGLPLTGTWNTNICAHTHTKNLPSFYGKMDLCCTKMLAQTQSGFQTDWVRLVPIPSQNQISSIKYQLDSLPETTAELLNHYIHNRERHKYITFHITMTLHKMLY